MGHHNRSITYTITKKYGDKVVPTHEGLIVWHPGKKQLVLWEIDNKGNLTESVMVVCDNKISYNELTYQSDGATLPVRAETISTNDDALVFTASIMKYGDWVEVFRYDYKRVKKDG